MAKADLQYFISAVSSEFGEARAQVASDLRSRGVIVRFAEDFRADGDAKTTLAKLHDYISECSGVLGVLGTRSGAVPPRSEMQQYAEMLPEALAEASYVQWELIFARHYQKRLFLYQANDDYESDVPSHEQDNPELQANFVKWLFDDLGFSRGIFSHPDELARLVLQEDWPRLNLSPQNPLRALLDRYPVSPQLQITDFARLGTATQLHRAKTGASNTSQLTRTTALWVLTEMDTDIREKLTRAGVSQDRLGGELKIGESLKSDDVDDVDDADLHEDLAYAISTYLDDQSGPTSFGLAELGAAILHSAGELDRGLLGKRLSAMGADLGVVEVALDPKRDQIRYIGDDPSRRDDLKRDVLASALVDQLNKARTDPELSSFAVHLDGPWGAGKSTLLHLIAKRLAHSKDGDAGSRKEPGWLLCEFDAWRESRIGPAWWSLTTALRRAVQRDLPWRKRAAFWFGARCRLFGWARIAAIVSVVALVAGFAVLIALTRPSVSVAEGRELVALTTGAVAVLGSAWIGIWGISRFVSLDSSRGAKAIEEGQADPRAVVARQVQYYLKKARRPVVMLIDDLDRCPHPYVVELLDALQTMIRNPGLVVDGHSTGAPKSASRSGHRRPQPILLVVAADGRWIRRSYEVAHREFAEALAEPGKPLGYLFLEKIFQLTVPVPALSPVQQRGLMRSILREGDAAEPALSGSLLTDDEARERLLAAPTRDGVITVFNTDLSADQRDRLLPDVDKRLRTDRQLQLTTEHELEAYAGLLPPNPRAMKRFVMAFDITTSVRIAEGAGVHTDPLARWILAKTRWPELTDFLASHPDAISGDPPLPDRLRVPDLQEVETVLSTNGSLFDPDLIRRCAGSAPVADD